MTDTDKLKMAVSDLQRYARETSGYAPPRDADFLDYEPPADQGEGIPGDRPLMSDGRPDGLME